jgi:hypothetical protein
MKKRIIRVVIVACSFTFLTLMANYILMIDATYLTIYDKAILNMFHFLFPLTVFLIVSPPLLGFKSAFKDFL